ncbi:hypothetical protein Tco_0008641 [Tanacetum coccineum]
MTHDQARLKWEANTQNQEKYIFGRVASRLAEARAARLKLYVSSKFSLILQLKLPLIPRTTKKALWFVGRIVADSSTERLKRATTYVFRRFDLSLLSRNEIVLVPLRAMRHFISFEISFKTSSEHSDLNFVVPNNFTSTSFVFNLVFANRSSTVLNLEILIVCKSTDIWFREQQAYGNLVQYSYCMYLVNISKRGAFWTLNEDILKINDSDYQYAVSIKEDTAYPCLHSPKTTKETSPIRRIQESQYAVFKLYGNKIFWKILNVVPNLRNFNTPYPTPWIRRIDIDSSQYKYKTQKRVLDVLNHILDTQNHKSQFSKEKKSRRGLATHSNP